MGDLGVEARISLCKLAIKTIEECVGDPRQADALAHYQKQLAQLEAELNKKPEPIVIGLKPTSIFGKAGG